MTHDELRDYIDKFDAAGMVKEPTVAALRAIVELHKPWLSKQDNLVMCDHCCSEIYPCPTIQAIETELQ